MSFFQGPDQREPGDGLPLPLEAHRAGGELQPGPNAINILQACIYKSVNTGLFLKSLLAPSIVKLNVAMIDS